MRRKEKLTEEYIINGWLKKYHGITVEELVRNEPELCKTADWFRKYSVTQEQHDEWYKWAVKEIAKNMGDTQKYVERHFAFTYLNTAPNVKKDEQT